MVQETPIMPVTAPSAEQARGPTAHQVYERDAPGVVSVSATGVSESPTTSELVKGEGGEQGTSTGSGFEIDSDGTILTNWHVVENAVKVMVSLGEHRTAVQARILGKYPSSDIAILRIQTTRLTLHPLGFARSRAVDVGEPVLAIGNPFGYARTLTTGVVSAVGREIEAPNGVTISGVLQTDAPLDPGSSGGPLLNAQGEVIGINSQIVSAGGGGGDVGISFAIPIGAAERGLATVDRG
jgi:S1-C subfamily serine protease